MSDNAEVTTTQDQSTLTAKYKVGDEVMFAKVRCKIMQVMITYYLVDLQGEPLASKVGEYLLEAAQ